MPITTQDIADRLGVSRRVVGKVLLGGKSNIRVSENLRDRIVQTARQLNYRPNAAAQATRTGKFNAVALVSRFDSTMVPYELERGIYERLTTAEMHLGLAYIAKKEIEDEARMPKLLRELAVDGMIVHAAQDFSPDVFEMARRHDIPTVWVNTKGTHDCVYPDDRGMAYDVTTRLIALGHRRVAYFEVRVDWENDGYFHYSQADRVAGYAQAMRDAGLQPRHVMHVYRVTPDGSAPWNDAAGDDRLSRARAFLAEPDRPTAVLTNGIDAASPLCLAAAGLGLSPQHDLCVMTQTHEDIRGWGLGVCNALIPMNPVGRAAASMLLEKIARPSVRRPSVAVPYEEIQGSPFAPGR